MDQRLHVLADKVIQYSCSLKPGEKILIWYTGHTSENLARALVKAAYKAGGIPFVYAEPGSVQREVLLHCTKEQMSLLAERDLAQMRQMDAYVTIRGWDNISEYADVPDEKMEIYQKYYWRPVHSQRIDHTKWVVLRYPSLALAQSARTSLETFEDMYFNVCNLDYGKMSQAMDKLVDLLNRTDRVTISGPETNLEFSIKNIPAVKLDGKINVPDGEVYTAPVRDSVNGIITFNCPSVYQGVTFDKIMFEFRQGQIVRAEAAGQSDRLNQILDTDEGARYIGEFAFGVNPYIHDPILDILFDEKIAGSFHLTPGRAYKNAYNGNESAIHWDLVSIQTPKYGGGQIHFDGVLVQADGRFVLPELECLNPENLK